MIRCKMYVVFLLLLLSAGYSAGQVNDVVYGKNRVQYSDDFDSRWIYDTEHFTLYWYGKARLSAIKTIGFVEMDFERVEQLLEYKISRPIEVLIFASVEDLKQSNLGIEEAFTLEGQVTKVYGNKILVFYDGDTRDLRRQVREGVAQVMLQSMLYGDFLKEVFQKTYLKRMPKWFESGLASYCGQPWGPDTETHMHRLYRDGYFETPFEKWSNKFPKIGGHAFWHFIAEHYDEKSISDFLYLIRINKEIYSSSFYAFGVEWERLISEMTKYYKDRYGSIDLLFNTVAEQENTPIISFKHHAPFTDIQRGPGAGQWTLALNDHGRRRVYLMDSTPSGRHLKLLYRDGSYNTLHPPDLEYPKVAIAPQDSSIAVVYSRRGKLYLKRYSAMGVLIDFQELRPEIRRIYDMDITRTGDLLLSADISGSADILLYTISNRNIHPLIQDFWDDPDLCYFIQNEQEGAIIASNRDSALAVRQARGMGAQFPKEKMDLYLLTWTRDRKPNKLIRLTNTPQADERHPQQVGPGEVAFISDYFGYKNIHWLALDEAPLIHYGHVASLLVPEIGAYWWQLGTDMAVDMETSVDRHALYSVPPLDSTALPSSLLAKEKTKTETSSADTAVGHRKISYDPLHFFQTKFSLPPSYKTLPKPKVLTTEDLLSLVNGKAPSSKGKPTTFNSAQAYAYQKQFRIYNFGTTIDNSPLFDGWIPFENINGSQIDRSPVRAPTGLLLKLHLKELFEDYELITGTRVTSGLDTWEQYVQWLDKKHLLDKTWTLYRSARKYFQTTPALDLIYSKDIALAAQYKVKFPLDVYRSLRASATFRQERSFDLISDISTLDKPVLDRQRIGVKLAYVMDNTTVLDLNILRGTRYRISTEGWKRFTLDVSPWTFRLNDPWTFVAAWDARHYLPVLRHSIFALRWAGALSLGPERILYLLGGTSDEINYRINSGYPISPDVAFGYKTVAPPLRGFSYNARNGSAYSLVNAEFRLPITRYLFARPSKWSFIRHLQLVGFADAGLGWYGWNPFDPNSNHNIQSFENPAVKLKVRFYTDPILMGYGAGLRTSFLGYFLRLDYARGLANGVLQPPRIHLSLGLDF